MIFEFTQQLFKDVTETLTGKDGSEPKDLTAGHFQNLVASSLRKCDLVTREEFDTQQAVLHETRKRLESLEKILLALENQHSPTMSTND